MENFLNCTKQEPDLDINGFYFREFNETRDKNGTDAVTALMLAAEHGLSDMVSELIKLKADVNVQDSDNLTALGKDMMKLKARKKKTPTYLVSLRECIIQI